MSYIKKTVRSFNPKNLINEISLHCIASYVAGAYTVLLVNFFYFDNHITPPGVSAFVAAMALLFTIYAASKVKDWYVSKLNDKAFEKTDAILVKYSQLFQDIVVANGYVTSIFTEEIKPLLRKPENKKAFQIHFKVANDRASSMTDTVREISVLTRFIQHWDVKPTKKLSIRLDIIYESAHKFQSLFTDFQREVENNFDVYEYNDSDLNSLGCMLAREYGRIIECLKQIQTSSHDELFSISTQPK